MGAMNIFRPRAADGCKNRWVRLAVLSSVLAILCGCGAGAGGSSSSSSSASSSSSSSASSSSSSSSSSSGIVPDTGTLTLQEGDGGVCYLRGVVESEHAGFSGAGYSNPENAPGLALVWHVHTTQPGNYQLVLRYANGAAETRPGVLSINGRDQANVVFNPTGAWTNWQELATDIALAYGNNTLTLTATGSTGLANMDFIRHVGRDVRAGNCATALIVAPAQAEAGAAVEFSAQTFSKGGNLITAFDWSFGDSSAATGSTVSHSYTSTGRKTVTLTLTDFSGGQSAVETSIEVKQMATGPIKVYIAGDSTVSTYADTASPNDQAGWGQMLAEHYTSQVSVDNRALGGRTARRFIDEGHLDGIWRDIRAGDYLLVQFGTNDGHTSATYTLNGQTIPYYLEPQTAFKSWLQRYVDGAKARGVQLVFVTPPPRNSAYCTGANGTGAHAQAMRELAAANGVPLVDLNASMVELLKNTCPAPVPERIYLVRADGSIDGTHFQEYGARVMSSMVAQAMARAGLSIAQFAR
jgi:lysophospholipase L1-like esterase